MLGLLAAARAADMLRTLGLLAAARADDMLLILGLLAAARLRLPLPHRGPVDGPPAPCDDRGAKTKKLVLQAPRGAVGRIAGGVSPKPKGAKSQVQERESERGRAVYFASSRISGYLCSAGRFLLCERKLKAQERKYVSMSVVCLSVVCLSVFCILYSVFCILYSVFCMYACAYVCCMYVLCEVRAQGRMYPPGCPQSHGGLWVVGP